MFGCSSPQEKPKGVTLDKYPDTNTRIVVGDAASVMEYRRPLMQIGEPSIIRLMDYGPGPVMLVAVGNEMLADSLSIDSFDDKGSKVDRSAAREKSLDELIQERQQDAINKKLFEKWRDIATYLGSEDKKKPKFQLGPSYTFDNGTFVVKYRSYDIFPNIDLIRVTYKRKLVFEADAQELDESISATGEVIRKKVTSIQISSYIPGEWEEEFNTLLGQAEKKKKETKPEETQEEKEKKEALLLEKAKRFGLEEQLKKN